MHTIKCSQSIENKKERHFEQSKFIMMTDNLYDLYGFEEN